MILPKPFLKPAKYCPESADNRKFARMVCAYSASLLGSNLTHCADCNVKKTLQISISQQIRSKQIKDIGKQNINSYLVKRWQYLP